MFQLKNPAAQINKAGILIPYGSGSAMLVQSLKKLPFQRGVFRIRIPGDLFPNNGEKFLFQRTECSLLVPVAWKSFRRVWEKYVAFFLTNKTYFYPHFCPKKPDSGIDRLSESSVADSGCFSGSSFSSMPDPGSNNK
jgi:hypothetical protein